MSKVEEEIVEYLRQKGVEEEKIDKYRRRKLGLMYRPGIELGEELERGLTEHLRQRGYIFEEGGESLEDYVVMRLRHIGVEGEVVETPKPGFWITKKPPKTMVRLTGKNVDEIRLQKGQGAPPITRDFPAEIQLWVLFDKPLSREAKREVKAKSKVIKQNKKLGLFGGKLTDVKWVGNRIVDYLNQDMELRTKLIAAKEGFKHIKIRPEGKSAVDIKIVLETTSVGLDELIIMTDHFSDYDRIAKHVRDVLGAY